MYTRFWTTSISLWMWMPRARRRSIVRALSHSWRLISFTPSPPPYQSQQSTHQRYSVSSLFPSRPESRDRVLISGVKVSRLSNSLSITKGGGGGVDCRIGSSSSPSDMRFIPKPVGSGVLGWASLTIRLPLPSPLRLSKIMTHIQYVLIILKYHDYNTPLSIFWITWLVQLNMIHYDYDYNKIWQSYLVILFNTFHRKCNSKQWSQPVII